MKKSLIVIASALLLASSAFAQEAKKPSINWYGFIRTYFAFDSRESSAGTEDLYYYMPKDVNMVGDSDLNGIPSFRFAALTSRLGVDVNGYEFNGFKMNAKIEADFYNGVSGVTGTAVMRLRQAFVTLAKNDFSLKVGQAWHPMAIDLPDIFSLESGAPFGAFSRTPQVTLDYNLSDRLYLEGSAIWQMQYTSTGPDGNSANYIKYGCTPELFLALNYKNGSNIVRLGVDMTSIKPRNYANDPVTDKAVAKVSDRLTTFNLFEYAQATAGYWTFKEKLIYANDGSHMNLVGGYGVSKVNTDGSWEYSATRNLSFWGTATYKKSKTWVPSILLGYIENFGTSEELVGSFWCKNSADKVAQMYRIQPEIVYNLGKFALGLEYMCTAVQYGKSDAKFKYATDDLHWVTNNRFQMMVKYTF